MVYVWLFIEGELKKLQSTIKHTHFLRLSKFITQCHGFCYSIGVCGVFQIHCDCFVVLCVKTDEQSVMFQFTLFNSMGTCVNECVTFNVHNLPVQSLIQRNKCTTFGLSHDLFSQIILCDRGVVVVAFVSFTTLCHHCRS